MPYVPSRPDHRGQLVLAIALWLTAPAAAQDAGTKPAPRAPATGIPILECAPPLPAPADSCVLRVPPGFTRDDVGSTVAGVAAGDGGFEAVQPGSRSFPKDLALTETMLLVDLTVGPGNRRQPTFGQEKTLLKILLDELPPQEPVAIYGFTDGLVRLSDFSTDRAAQRAVIEGLKLTGVNTRIGTQTEAAITAFADRQDVLLRNILLASDGEEEGLSTAGAVIDAALAKNVSISTLGLFWRRTGSPEISQGQDFLQKIAGGTRGVFSGAQLAGAGANPTQAAQAAVRELSGEIASSLKDSALIVPKGDAAAAVIDVTLREPAAGARDRMVERPFKASFEPKDKVPTADGWRLMGLAWWIWALIAAGAVVLLGLVMALLMRRSHRGAVVIEEPPPQAPSRAPSPVPAWAYLVRQDTGERIAILGLRTAIGRSRENAVVLGDTSISRVHAQLHRNRDGGVSVTDMDSLNGTWVNDGRVVGTRSIDIGDTIRLGDVQMRLVLP